MLKCFCVSVYFCLIVCVPGMPSYYTFFINILGFIATAFASIFLIKFLNTRPTQQKNMLNRILALGGILLLLGASRQLIMSFIACFFLSQITELADTLPFLTIFLLSSRNIFIAALCSMCCLSAGRLLLFTKPVIFISLNSYTGVLLIVGLSLVGIIVDHLYRCLTCTEDQFKVHMLMQVFRAELGIRNVTFTTQAPTNQINSTLGQPEDVTDATQCSTIPVVKIGSACFLFLEASKFIYLLVHQYVKNKKEGKISPTVDDNLQPAKPATSSRPKITRSESFQENSRKVLKRERRASLQLQRFSDPKETLPISEIVITKQKALIKYVGPGSQKKNLKGILKQLCLRTSSLITVIIVIGLVVLISDAITNDESAKLSVIAHVITERLIMFVLVLLLCVFDKDLVMHFKEKFHFPNL